MLTLLALITVYAVVFHVIKVHVEGEQHSWITGFYWTLVVMTTLGFGDITFTSDIGRLFSIVVLLSGVVLLLVMLPFMFISLFYAPWLEARVRLRAPREVPEGTRGHVILTEYDAIATGLVERLRTEHIPYYVIEPDPIDGRPADRRGHHRSSPARTTAAPPTSGRTRPRRACCWPTARTRPTPTSRSPRARSPPTCRSWRSSRRRTPSTCCS